MVVNKITSFPVIISKERKWFVACCPLLDIATQGRTEEEVKENMADLIEEYMEDPDTQKPDWYEQPGCQNIRKLPFLF